MMKRLMHVLLMVLMLSGTAFAGININTATVAELESLPGIGPAKAEAIVKHREEHGSFKEAADLKQVKGIGDKVYEKISREVEVAN